MVWEILYTDTYADWFMALADAEQIDVHAMVEVLQARGAYLQRPYADTVKGSKKVKHLRELRIQHKGKPYRVFYAFDPVRRAVLLCGGRKDGAGDKTFYKRMIALAEDEFADYIMTF